LNLLPPHRPFFLLVGLSPNKQSLSLPVVLEEIGFVSYAVAFSFDIQATPRKILSPKTIEFLLPVGGGEDFFFAPRPSFQPHSRSFYAWR